MNLVEQLARVIELANGHTNVGIGRDTNPHAQLGTALGDLAAYGPMLSVDTVFKTMVVDLDNLVLGLGRQQHLIDIKGNTGATRVAQHEHLGMLQGIDIHLSRLGQRRAFSNLRIMHARNQIIQITRNQIEQRMLTAIRIAGNIECDRSVLAKQASVQRNDIGLGATQHQHAAPNARPDILVDKELVTAQVIGASRNHRAQMVGRSEHLQATLCRPVHILLNGRICMRREHRMGMNVTRKQVGHRVSLSGMAVAYIHCTHSLQ